MYNTQWLYRRAQSGDLNVGDHIVVYVSDACSLEPPWDHGYVTTQVSGRVVTVVVFEPRQS